MLWNLLALLGGLRASRSPGQCAELRPLLAVSVPAHVETASASAISAGRLAPTTTRLICSMTPLSCRLTWTRRSNCASASSSAFCSVFCAGTAAWKISSRACGSAPAVNASSRLILLGVPPLGRIRASGWRGGGGDSATEHEQEGANRPARTVGFMAGCPTIRPGYPVTFTARAANTYGNTAAAVSARDRARRHPGWRGHAWFRRWTCEHIPAGE